jgi:integrase/recombinase XerC
MNWTEAVESFVTDSDFTDATRKQYRRLLGEFRTWYDGSYDGEPDPDLLNEQVARDWRGYLSGTKGMAAASVNLRLSALRSFCRFHGNPLTRVKGVKQVRPAVEALNGHQLGMLERAVKNGREEGHWMSLRDAAIVALMARAGLRVGEVCGLDLDDVEIKTRSGSVTIRKGKGRKQRTVPLNKQVRSAYADYLEKRPRPAAGEEHAAAVFLSKSGKRVTPLAVQRLVQNGAQRAGIDERVHPHMLRHTFATRYLEAGGTLAELRDLLGHRNIATTDRYVHSNAAKVRERIERL